MAPAQAIPGSFEADLRALAGGDVAAELGGLESGVVTPGFTRARAGGAYLAAGLARARSAPDLTGLVTNQVEYDYGLLGAGPPNVIAALADARPDCSEEDR